MKSLLYILIVLTAVACIGKSEEVKGLQKDLNDLGDGLMKLLETKEISLKKEGLSLDFSKVKKGDLVIEIQNSPKITRTNEALYVDTIVNYLWDNTNFVDSNLSNVVVIFSIVDDSLNAGIPTKNEIKVPLDYVYGTIANKAIFVNADTLKAIKFYDKAISINPENLTLVANNAFIKYTYGIVEEAEKDLELVNEKLPNNFDICFLLGIINKEQEEFDKALEYYTTCVSLDENSTGVLGDIGYCLYQKKAFEEAMEYYDKALGLNANLQYLKPKKAILLLELGREEEFKKYVKDEWSNFDDMNAKLILNWKLHKFGNADSSCIMFKKNGYKVVDGMYSSFLSDLSQACK